MPAWPWLVLWQVRVVTAPGLRNTIAGDQLWDGDGRMWTRRHSAWLTAEEADRWVKRGQPIVLHPHDDGPVEWLNGEQAAAWWHDVKDHVETPGRSAAPNPDDEGRTWGAHVWRCDSERRIGLTAFC